MVLALSALFAVFFATRALSSSSSSCVFSSRISLQFEDDIRSERSCCSSIEISYYIKLYYYILYIIKERENINTAFSICISKTDKSCLVFSICLIVRVKAEFDPDADLSDADPPADPADADLDADPPADPVDADPPADPVDADPDADPPADSDANGDKDPDADPDP